MYVFPKPWQCIAAWRIQNTQGEAFAGMIQYSNQVVKPHTLFASKESKRPQVTAFFCNLAINTKKPLQLQKRSAMREGKSCWVTCWVAHWVEQLCRMCAVQWHNVVTLQQSPACPVGTQGSCGWLSWPTCSTAKHADWFLSQPTNKGWLGARWQLQILWRYRRQAGNFAPGELGVSLGVWGSEPSPWTKAGSRVDKSSSIWLGCINKQNCKFPEFCPEPLDWAAVVMA